MTDRSGRTFEEYRELYWAEKKRRKELEIMCRDLAYAEQEAQKQLAAVRAVIDDLERQLLHAVHLLRKELAGEEDE
jgi:hypothetical protein